MLVRATATLRKASKKNSMAIVTKKVENKIMARLSRCFSVLAIVEAKKKAFGAPIARKR